MDPRLALRRASISAAVLAIGVPPVAEAAFPGRNGPIAAFAERTTRTGSFGALEIFFGPRSTPRVTCTISDSAGSETTPCGRNPSFAPGGRRFAFDLEGRLMTEPLASSEQTILPPLTEHDSDPAWTADGRRLVFTGRRAGVSRLYSVATDGTALKALPPGQGRAPAVSRRGRVAYVASGPGGPFIHVLDPATGRSRRLVRGNFPDWAPSGRSIVFERGAWTHAIAASGRGPARLAIKVARRPVFSPDGRKIAFLRVARRDSANGSYSIFSALRDGSEAKLLRRGGELPIGSELNSYLQLAWGVRR